MHAKALDHLFTLALVAAWFTLGVGILQRTTDACDPPTPAASHRLEAATSSSR